MNRHIALPLTAGLFLIFAVVCALYIQRSEPETLPPVPPPVSPFGSTVAGAGMVEPSTEASTTGGISVGSQLPGTVTKISVHIGQEVNSGDLLFELDRRQAEADLQVRLAAQESAQAQLRRLEQQPRPEEVPPLEAQVRAAAANTSQARDLCERDRQMRPGGAVAPQDVILHEQAYQNAKAQWELAKANLALLKAGAWEADKVIAYANVEQARAQVAQARTNLDLLQVRAPVTGAILQVNIRPGECVASSPGQALILMGSIKPLHVRVNIDEQDLPRLRLMAPARARTRGDPRQEEIPMRFVRLEPYVVPKTSLTGLNTERVDTRVAQVIYAIDPGAKQVKEKKILVGQLLDVFIDTRPAGE